jgi:hypothetical protein
MHAVTDVCSRCGGAKPLTGSEFVNGKALPLCADCQRDKRLATLVRLFASNRPGEVEAAMRKFASTLQNAGSDVVNDIAERIEHPSNGALNEAAMQEVYDQGIKEGVRREKLRGQARHSAPQGITIQFPPARDMAMFCYRNIDELGRDWEREFVTNMASWTRTRPLSLKQQAHLEKIYLKLGGEI